MQVPAASSFERLVTLTAPGAPVAPVLAELDAAAMSLRDVRPALEQARASAWLLGELDRVRGGVLGLRDGLAELAAKDGMTTFDPAFAADDAAWDAWFVESAEFVRRAESVLAATEAPQRATNSSATSV